MLHIKAVPGVKSWSSKGIDKDTEMLGEPSAAWKLLDYASEAAFDLQRNLWETFSEIISNALTGPEVQLAFM